jgi:hypothetical protein
MRLRKPFRGLHAELDEIDGHLAVLRGELRED